MGRIVMWSIAIWVEFCLVFSAHGGSMFCACKCDVNNSDDEDEVVLLFR